MERSRYRTFWTPPRRACAASSISLSRWLSSSTSTRGRSFTCAPKSARALLENSGARSWPASARHDEYGSGFFRRFAEGRGILAESSPCQRSAAALAAIAPSGECAGRASLCPFRDVRSRDRHCPMHGDGGGIYERCRCSTAALVPARRYVDANGPPRRRCTSPAGADEAARRLAYRARELLPVASPAVGASAAANDDA